MSYLPIFWSNSVAYQGYNVPAAAIAEKIEQAAGQSGGGGGGGSCDCKITVTSNITVGGIPAGTTFIDTPLKQVVKQMLTADLPSTINISYSPTSIIEEGIPKTLTFTTQPNSGSSNIVKQTITFADGTVFEYNDGNSHSFTKELTIIGSTSVTIVATEEDGDTIRKTITINAYLPMYYGAVPYEGTQSKIISQAIVNTLGKTVKTSYTGNFAVNFSTGKQLVWFCVPSNKPINKVMNGSFETPMADPQTINLNVNGQTKAYKCYRLYQETSDIQTPYTETYTLS